MTRKRFRPYRWFTALAVFPMLLILGGAVALAKPRAKAATRPSPAASEESSASDAPAAPPAPDETPSAEPADSPSGTSTEVTVPDSTPPAAATSASPATEVAEPSNNKGQAEVADESRPLAEPPEPPPPGVEPIPATGVTGGQAPATKPPAPYVEHLGPESFPGRLRGLYGGSLWLEPSFHGLQWPYMAHTGIGVSGNFWLDSGYEAIRRDPSKFPNSSMSFGQGRGVLRVTPTYVHGRFFVQGQAELVGNLCQATNSGGPTNPTASTVCLSAGTFSTDDLWIRVGHWNIWDLKVGRFEGWEVYHLGMGMDQYTLERMGAGMFGISDIVTNLSQPLEAPSLYGVNYLHDRPTDGLAVIYSAVHIYATRWLRFELLTKEGVDNYRNDDKATGNAASTYFGARPTAILDVDWFKFKIGAEYQKKSPITQDPTGPGATTYKTAVEQTIQMGVGASMQFVIHPYIEFGLNGAIGRQEYTNSSGNTPNMPGMPGVLTNSYTTKSVGGFANLRLFHLCLLGLGLNLTEQTDDYFASLNNTPPVQTGPADFTRHWQGFVALQYLLFGQLFIKGEFGYAQAYFQPSDPAAATWSNRMYSGRTRLMYIF